MIYEIELFPAKGSDSVKYIVYTCNPSACRIPRKQIYSDIVGANFTKDWLVRYLQDTGKIEKAGKVKFSR